MGKAFENCVALFGDKGASPGLLFEHFVFELVEDLFEVPSVFIEQHELIGWQGEVVGDVCVALSIYGVDVNNAP